ncbi:MAG: tRNA-binding protein [Candidatus Thermoplasmatota archaeon]|nr:tRNA-binding protein [Candidatus Thermoplasmatota archaeon]
MNISFDDFLKVEIRVGAILDVQDFPEAKKPAYRLTIDFGDFGIKRSSAQIRNYEKRDLIGMKIVAVTNFPPKQVANFISEVLVLGVLSSNGVILLTPTDPEKTKPGDRIA